MADSTVDNPFFARMWIAMSSRERRFMTKLRQENLAGLSGRVLEIGAGTGTNFAFYPDTVTEVVAVEPEVRLARLAREAARKAPVLVTVRTETVENFDSDDVFDAVVCSLVLCSVDDPESVLRQMYSRLKPGAELRYFEHVASEGARGRAQRFLDSTFWPKISGNCHAHRQTEQSIVGAGFEVADARRIMMLPGWVPMSEAALGRAVRPA
ncbi:class I SAM-dependent methyltransferase [Mycobacterium sp. CBMA293]|uniref:class I SAM-dependent methyltransferase n=1 Tax=unclassified Mycolicibacterium TaxID=2636767 RepID=UPI0012DED701|nr:MULTISPECIES: class I SAM-dependent methyltransferase [unclassified Mycolicibacterium]MUL45867.1 class I SAM-dependent methyltransferase [Mycolicibacterium sp. CBMA 360]MUL60539.1 class I SAM-dependent methyltransferase [Mycolicibacterium sp. CBMA 335]MUL72354.1 class I SAM-dependent methyltransferase [Mycolicibacterium sp. CBMA 311]MUL95245.1 class I SAM-dependent methyltransferase [Mycolicibacterium sp. CBMA 230]MUM06936.1 SAM-dependent methyltransferase [Mycolicibacterium sp. CBMA 213]